MRITKCRHNVVFIMWFSRIHIHSWDFIITFWLSVISHNDWVMVFRCPSTNIYVHTRAGSWMCPTSFRCPSTLGWMSTCSWLAFTVWGFLIPLGRFFKSLSYVSRFLPLFGGRVDLWVTSTLSGTFTMGTFYFVTPLYSVNATGRLFALLCKFIIFWTSSSDSFVRRSKD
jgi:hypothetical protein